MLNFKAEMHQIRFRLGLCPRPRWGSSQHSPDPLAGLKGSYSATSKGRGGDREEREGEKKEGEGEGRGKEGEGGTGHLPHGRLQTLAALTAVHQ